MGRWSKVEYKTKSGYVLTDEMLEDLGDAISRGEYPGNTGRVIVAPVGRPPLYPNDELVTVAFKIPRSFRDKLDTEAKKKSESRSKFLREVLNKALLWCTYQTDMNIKAEEVLQFTRYELPGV